MLSGVNFINVIRPCFSYEFFAKAKMQLEKAAETTFVRKNFVCNVDEICTWLQMLKIHILVELGVGKVALSSVRAVNCRLLCHGKVVDFCNLTKCFVNYAKMLRYFPEDRLKLKYTSSSKKIACFLEKKIKTFYL
jgi:hypothetical protein